MNELTKMAINFDYEHPFEYPLDYVKVCKTCLHESTIYKWLGDEEMMK